MKRWRALLIAAVLLLPASAAAASDSVEVRLFPVTFVINNQAKEPGREEAVFNHNGRVYVPIRFVSESLGARVDYDAKERKVVIGNSNVFQAEYVKVGDRIAGMEVVHADLTESDSEYLGTVHFKGSALITGTFLYEKHNPIHEELFQFFVDEASLERIPMMSHDTRTQWFAFSNLSEAKKMFGIVDDAEVATGRAAVVIDDFRIRYDYKEVYNTARLVEAFLKTANGA